LNDGLSIRLLILSQDPRRLHQHMHEIFFLNKNFNERLKNVSWKHETIFTFEIKDHLLFDTLFRAYVYSNSGCDVKIKIVLQSRLALNVVAQFD
jgi:hypothetical protein